MPGVFIISICTFNQKKGRTMKIYTSTCTFLDICRFGRRVTGTERFDYGMNGAVPLPISQKKGRRNHNAAFGQDNSRLSPGEPIRPYDASLGLFPNTEKLQGFRFQSKRGNKCQFTRLDEERFAIRLVQKVRSSCFYWETLERIGVKLTATTLPEVPLIPRPSGVSAQ